LVGHHAPRYTAWQTPPDEAEIWPDSKMSRAAQKSGQKQAQIVQCMSGFTLGTHAVNLE